MADVPAVLSVSGLHIEAVHRSRPTRLVDDISFSIVEGELLALVGESGCGKSITALALAGLLDNRSLRVTAGSIKLKGQELTELHPGQWSAVRGRHIGMVFQEPMTALNPLMTVGNQIVEVIRRHQNVSRTDAEMEAVNLLRHVQITSPERRLRQYPHELSGGMRQRVVIAIAISCRPALLVADEPTTALDVSVQAGILDLLDRLRAEYKCALLLITHDMGIVAQRAHRVAVMYAGRLVETAPTGELFAAPTHPYTQGLLGAIPKLGISRIPRDQRKLFDIPGTVPLPGDFPLGCRFSGRCAVELDRCVAVQPAMHFIRPDHTAACHRIDNPR